MSRKPKLGMGMAGLEQDISQEPKRPVYAPQPSLWKRTKIFLLQMLVIGGVSAGAGGYLAYSYEHENYLHVIALGLAGGCLTQDMEKKPRWDPCADYLIQKQTEEHAIALQEKITEAINDMNKPPKPIKQAHK